MLKLNASYSKKVPAEGEYSSQSYHASIEVELPDGLTQDQLQSRIHETFEMVRNSVESELHGNTPSNSGGQQVQNQTQNQQQGYSAQPRNNGQMNNGSGYDVQASSKQINYLLSLASRRGISPSQIAAQNGVETVADLTKKQCSALIEQWKAA